MIELLISTASGDGAAAAGRTAGPCSSSATASHASMLRRRPMFYGTPLKKQVEIMLSGRATERGAQYGKSHMQQAWHSCNCMQ